MQKIKRDDLQNEDYDTSNKSCSSHSIIFFIILATIAVIASIYYLIPGEVGKQIMNVEYSKVWWKDNYEIINKMQLEQIKTFVAQYKQKWWDTANKPTDSQANAQPQANNNAPATQDSIKTLTKDQLAAIKKWAYVQWNKDAKISIVEYSDLECPFCIRQFSEWNIEKAIAKIGNTVVNSIFKPFRWVPHENSEAEANATLCAGELGWLDAYNFYYKQIFTRTKGWNWTWFSLDNLVPLAKEAWIDTKKFQACIDSKRNIAVYDANTTEWKNLWVQWTPGNVIINNETGKYELIAWAYPESEFERVITELLK